MGCCKLLIAAIQCLSRDEGPGDRINDYIAIHAIRCLLIGMARAKPERVRWTIQGYGSKSMHDLGPGVATRDSLSGQLRRLPHSDS
jgi:hypothetical protein